MSEMWLVKNKHQADLFCEFVRGEQERGVERTYSIFKPEAPQRSVSQNKGGHAAFRRLSEALNNAGFGIPHPFRPEIEIPYSEHSVKEMFFRPITKALYNKESTTELTTEEMSHAFEVMMGRITELTGVYVEGIDGR